MPLSRNLSRRYRELENQFQMSEACETYANLVRANGNSAYPIQRWFHFKEAYSIELLETLLLNWRVRGDNINRVLDPFTGVGTTLLACQRLAHKTGNTSLQFTGIERNPFLHFVAQTKVLWHRYDGKRLLRLARKYLRETNPDSECATPLLSTLQRREVYSRGVLSRLCSLKGRLLAENHGYLEKYPLLLGFASILENVSGVRKDGRALRIVPGKKRQRISEALEQAWSNIGVDITVAKQHYFGTRGKVWAGDGRTLTVKNKTSFRAESFDLIMYSPPYLNNIDYTEVYKIELWMCGFLKSRDEFRNLRYQTFRSHPSVRFAAPMRILLDPSMAEVCDCLEVLVDALPDDKNRNWRTDLFIGYFDDMYISLEHQYNVLKPGGWVFCVVGNSLHGPSREPYMRVPVASDLLIAKIARTVGFQVKAIQIARHLSRRSPAGHFMRESIIVLRKPL